MLNGSLYNSRDPELIALYFNARRLLQAYNKLPPENLTERDVQLTSLLGHKAPGVWVEMPFLCDYGKFISIGENTFVNFNCIFLDNNLITIGSNGLIGPAVQIYTATHPLKAAERVVAGGTSPYRTSSKPVTIGDNVWIGGNTVICPGIIVGNNVTIGAGSVVTKSLPDNVLAFGNPCRIIREI